MAAIDLFSVLTSMSTQCGLPFGTRGCDINIVRATKAESLTAAINLEEVKLKSPRRFEIGAHGQDAGDLVIRVRVDWPVGEDYVWIFVREKFAYCFGARLVQLGCPVDL